MNSLPLHYDEPIEIAQGIYWVGGADQVEGLHCNPYLIVDHGEAVLIDSGSRGDFSTVMLKTMRTGTNPKDIRRLIYQHYDPDLCGNLPYMEALILNPELKVISHHENNVFIRYYSAKTPRLCVEAMDFAYRFASGRTLRFIRTPYCHSPGSFMTYDEKTKVLFSSDLFGSYDANWNLYTEISADCERCEGSPNCPRTGKPCKVLDMLDFHQRIMTSRRALLHALDQVQQQEVSLIAPQHGSLLHTAQARDIITERLRALQNIGIDFYLKESRT